MNTENNNEFGFTEEEIREQRENEPKYIQPQGRAKRDSKPIRTVKIVIDFDVFFDKTETSVNIDGVTNPEAIGIIRNCLNQLEYNLINR